MGHLQRTGNGTQQCLPDHRPTSGDRTRIMPSTPESGSEFSLSGPELMNEADGDWGVTVFASKDVFLATFVYRTKEAADSARELLPLAYLRTRYLLPRARARFSLVIFWRVKARPLY